MKILAAITAGVLAVCLIGVVVISVIINHGNQPLETDYFQRVSQQGSSHGR